MANSEWMKDPNSAEERVRKHRYSKMKKMNREMPERPPKIRKPDKNKFKWNPSYWDDELFEDDNDRY